MKHGVICLAFLIIAGGCSAGGQREAIDLPESCDLLRQAPITGDSIGPLAIGILPDSVHQLCDVASDVVELGAEAIPVRVLRVPMDEDTVAIEVDEGRIWRISVVGPNVRTADGLGVGSTLADLSQVGVEWTALGESAVFVQLRGRCGLSFQLAYVLDAVELTQPWTLERLERIPAETPVTRVLIFGCGSER